jgi:hypothetical protein
MDRWSDHFLTCMCHGDGTIRHNAIRNIWHRHAEEASLNPEREKAGLLPDRPNTDDLLCGPGRRPADVWFLVVKAGRVKHWISLWLPPCGRTCSAEVWTNLHWRSNIINVKHASSKALRRVAKLRGFTSFLLCSKHTAGVGAVPPEVYVIGISGQIAAVQNGKPGQVSLNIAQRISIALHREHARAILRRMSDLPSATALSAWEGSGVEMQF